MTCLTEQGTAVISSVVFITIQFKMSQSCSSLWSVIQSFIRSHLLAILVASMILGSAALPADVHPFVPFDDQLAGDYRSDESERLGLFPQFDFDQLIELPSQTRTTDLQHDSDHTTTNAKAIGQMSEHVDHRTSTGHPRTGSSCNDVFCPAGRICRILRDRPKCVCRDSCPVRNRETCGSDGLIYHNHCELHRTACLQHRHIAVDLSGNACKKSHGNEADVSSVFTTTVTIGNSVELKCGLSKNRLSGLLWKRNGASLTDSVTDEIKIYEDGSLYIGNLALRLMGNYTCHNMTTGNVIQKHHLIVQAPPHVSVYPRHHFSRAGATMTLKCHADGVPQPIISWQHDGHPLDGHLVSSDATNGHYVLLRNNTTLELQSVEQSGSFDCYARNPAGSESHSASITVETGGSKRSASYEENMLELFVVFHDRGYTVYEVIQCHVKHEVSSNFLLLNTFPELGPLDLGTLCPGNESCLWGDATVVEGLFIYVTQPQMKRIIVVDLKDRFNPVEVILIEGYPVSLNYIDHLDQLWVISLTEMTKDAAKKAVVLRDAGKVQRHHPVHIQPDDIHLGATGNKFEFDDLFLSTQTNLREEVIYGYSTSNHKMALKKLDLMSLKYVKEIDLGKHQCFPKGTVFIPIGGYLMVSCEHLDPVSAASEFLLILDSVTDAVLEKSDVGGRLYISPDTRHVVVLARNGKVVSAYKITDEGKLEHRFDEYLENEVNHLEFVSSDSDIGYTVFAVSFSQSTLLVIDLSSGKVSLIEGVGYGAQPPWWAPVKRNHIISLSLMFADHLMMSSGASVTTFDRISRRAQCTWQDVTGGSLIVALPLS